MTDYLFYWAKSALIGATGLSKDALHVYVGLIVMLLAVVFLRSSLRSLLPWSVVCLAACSGEAVDLLSVVTGLGYPEWSSSLHDVANTLAWPTVFLVLARYTALLGVRPNIALQVVTIAQSVPSVDGPRASSPLAGTARTTA